ncbi:MAG: 30S ribosomal protein S25e [Desulfurococcus sp.]|uniref:30S ribosomal protein S25e n=1 Tax=Desulfurococcus sp. TaxID=51678 RepID=UPI003166A988
MSEKKKPAQQASSGKEFRANIFEPTEDILKRLKTAVSKQGVKYYTPYILAQELNIRVSVARKILREAERRGILKLYSGGRRAPIYVPA